MNELALNLHLQSFSEHYLILDRLIMDNKQSEILGSLARLYLFIAAIDHKFQDVEELTIKEKLIEWDIGADQEDLDSVISSAIESLKSQEQLTQIIEQSIEIIDKNIDEDNKIILLKDLIEIAISDGDLDDEERDLISALAKEWDLPDYDNVDKYIREVIINLAANLKSPDDFLKEEGLTDEQIEILKIDEKDSSDWSIIHDIIMLLIYTGVESVNNTTNLQWEIIASNIVKFKLNIDKKDYSVSGYNLEELEELVNFVVDTMNGDQSDPRRPTNYFNQSVKNIADYYKRGELDDTNIHAIVKLMFYVSIADGFLADSEKEILEHIIKRFIGNVPSLEVIEDLIEAQIMSQELKRDIVMKEPNILDPGGIKLDPKTGEMDFELPTFKEMNSEQEFPAEIIAEVLKTDDSYSAKMDNTDEDITELIDNQAKLKYAYEHSGFVRGKKDKDGNYKWRVMG